MLRSYVRHDYPMILGALQLDGLERVIDAGGGMGALANLMLDVYPGLQITVIDCPEVIDQARLSQADRAGLKWLPGNLFAPWGIEADVVVLACVLRRTSWSGLRNRRREVRDHAFIKEGHKA